MISYEETIAYTHGDCSGHAGHALGHALGTNKDKNIEGIALWVSDSLSF